MKKVLIITYYWPPSGGPEVQRALKFAKYLPDYGWHPVILTTKFSKHLSYCPELIFDISYSTKIYRSPCFISSHHTERNEIQLQNTRINPDAEKTKLWNFISNWIRLNVFIPDRCMFWIPFAVSAGLEIIKREKISLILSLSPPNSTHLIANHISRLSGLYWVSDFQQPWPVNIPAENEYRTFWSNAIHQMQKKRVLEKSSQVLSSRLDILQSFKKEISDGKMFWLPNGFDHDDYLNITVIKNNRFTLSYYGSLTEEQIPYSLLSVLSKFKQGNIFFSMNLIGPVCTNFLNLLMQYDLMDSVKHLETLPRKELLKILVNSDILMIFTHPDLEKSGMVLHDTLFYYLGTKKPILAFGSSGCLTHEIILDTDSGEFIEYNDQRSTEIILIRYYHNWKEGKQINRFNTTKYSMLNLTQGLVDRFEQGCTQNVSEPRSDLR